MNIYLEMIKLRVPPVILVWDNKFNRESLGEDYKKSPGVHKLHSILILFIHTCVERNESSMIPLFFMGLADRPDLKFDPTKVLRTSSLDTGYVDIQTSVGEPFTLRL